MVRILQDTITLSRLVEGLCIPSVISSTSPLSPKHWANRHADPDASLSMWVSCGGRMFSLQTEGYADTSSRLQRNELELSVGGSREHKCRTRW